MIESERGLAATRRSSTLGRRRDRSNAELTSTGVARRLVVDAITWHRTLDLVFGPAIRSWRLRDSPLAPGASIAGHRIEAPLGGGAMGFVYRARAADGTPVALKVLHPEVLEHWDLRRRFEREAHALAAATHVNVIGVRELGEADGRLFLEAFVQRALAKDPDARFFDAGAMRRALTKLPRPAAWCT